MVAILNPKDMINTELDLSTAIKEIGILTQSNIELKETKEKILESHTELCKVLKLLLIQSLNSRGITLPMESQVLSALQTAEKIKS